MTSEIACATSAAVGSITDDDECLARELESRGYSVHAVVWNAADVDWGRFAAVIVRSTWDYHLHIDAFRAWLSHLEELGVTVWNPPALMRWNTAKTYLRQLVDRGVSIVETRWVAQHERTSLASIVEAAQWEQFVVKPSVSASAHRTWRGSISEAVVLEANFRAAVTHGGVLVQRFLPEVTSDGEWSLLFYGGEFSHAVIKRPRAGDFRVQREHGGSSRSASAPAYAIASAGAALHEAEVLHAKSAYARVDGCLVNNRFVLMELELIEPDLYLRSHADAPRRLADALAL